MISKEEMIKAMKEVFAEITTTTIEDEKIRKLELFADQNQKLRTELELVQKQYRKMILNQNIQNTQISIQKLQLENRIRELETENRKLKELSK